MLVLARWCVVYGCGGSFAFWAHVYGRTSMQLLLRRCVDWHISLSHGKPIACLHTVCCMFVSCALETGLVWRRDAVILACVAAASDDGCLHGSAWLTAASCCCTGMLRLIASKRVLVLILHSHVATPRVGHVCLPATGQSRKRLDASSVCCFVAGLIGAKIARRSSSNSLRVAVLELLE